MKKFFQTIKMKISNWWHILWHKNDDLSQREKEEKASLWRWLEGLGSVAGGFLMGFILHKPNDRDI